MAAFLRKYLANQIFSIQKSSETCLRLFSLPKIFHLKSFPTGDDTLDQDEQKKEQGSARDCCRKVFETKTLQTKQIIIQQWLSKKKNFMN